MGSPHDLVEFYVTCNPPLLPCGVDFVIRSTTESPSNSEVIELLYEPDIPWFKAITKRANQLNVTKTLQHLLREIVEQDTDYAYQERACSSNDDDDPVDVSIIGNTPRVLPWSQLQNASSDNGRCDLHQFPVSMQVLKHRAVWRGLEIMDRWTCDFLLCRLASWWKDSSAPASIQDLEELVECQVSHNLAGNMVYIGSDRDSAAVDKALQTLDNFLRICIHGGYRRDHLILTEGPGPFRTAYKWLSHMGQDRTTYVLGNRARIADEYSRLQTAVTLRAERQAADGYWVPDQAHYLFNGGLKPGTAKVFGPFHKYQYPKKQPEAVSQLFKDLSQAQRAPPQGARALDKFSGSQPMLLDSDRDVKKVAEEVASKPIESASRHSPKNFVESWRDAVGRAEPEAADEPWQESQPVQDLMFFDEPNQTDCANESGLIASVSRGNQLSSSNSQGTTEAMDRFNKSDDLILLEYETPSKPAHPVPSRADQDDSLLHAALSDKQLQPNQEPDAVSTQKQQSLLDSENPPLAHSELRPEEPKPSTETMDQGAGHSKPHLLKAATPIGKTFGQKPARQSHILKLVEARVKDLASILPLTPGNISLELKFGRFYLKDISHSRINIGSGPYWTVADMVESLRADVMLDERIGFSTILSTCGPDVDDLVRITPEQGQWRLLETQVLYEFTCTLEGQEKFVVELDSQSLKYHCRGLKEEMSNLYLHCVHRPWDMQVCVSRWTPLDKSSMHMAIARALVASLLIRTSHEGELTVEVTTDERLEATIGSINVRHVARYCQEEESSSILSVIMTKRLARGEKQERRMKWCAGQNSNHDTGVPGLWYEASLSSPRARGVFQENLRLKLGEQASWNWDDPRMEGVIEDIYRPAFSMVTQMDGIGLLNDNEQGKAAHNSFHDTVAEAKERHGKKTFW